LLLTFISIWLFQGICVKIETRSSLALERDERFPNLRSMAGRLAGAVGSFFSKPRYNPLEASRLEYAEDHRQRKIRMNFERTGIYQRYAPELFLGPNLKTGIKDDNTPLAPPFADPFATPEGPLLKASSRLYKIPNTFGVRPLPIPFADGLPPHNSNIFRPPFLANPQSMEIGIGKPPALGGNKKRPLSIKDLVNRGATSAVASPFKGAPSMAAPPPSDSAGGTPPEGGEDAPSE